MEEGLERRREREEADWSGRRNREKMVFGRPNTCKGEQTQSVEEMARVLPADEGREENLAFPSSCTVPHSAGRQRWRPR